MGAFFLNIYEFFKGRKKIFWSVLSIIVITLGLLASRLHFVTNINEMIPSNDKVDLVKSYTLDNENAQLILIGISQRDTSYLNQDELVNIKENLSTSIQEQAQIYLDTSYDNRISITKYYRLLQRNLPFLLNENDWANIEKAAHPDSVRQHIKRQIPLLQDQNISPYVHYNFRNDPLGLTKYPLHHLEQLKGEGDVVIYNQDILTADQKSILFNIKSKYGSNAISANKPLVGILQDLKVKFEKEYPAYKVHLYGGPIVAVGNADQMTIDTIVTLSITVICLVALTFYAFRKKRITLIMFTPVLFGVLFSLAMCYLIQGKLSIMAIGIGAVILGIALDFSIHFINHWRYEKDIQKTIKHIAQPLILGGITTIGAFIILQFAAAPILNDLGLFAALGLLGAVSFTLIVLPHLLPKHSPYIKQNYQRTIIDRVAAYQPEQNKWLVAGIILLTPILWFYSSKVKFDGDLLHMNYTSEATDEATAFFNKAYNINNSNSFLMLRKNEDHSKVLEQLAAYEQKGWVSHITHNSNLLPDSTLQSARIARWKAYWNTINIKELNTAIAQETNQAQIKYATMPQFEPFQYAHSYIDAADFNALKQLHSFYNEQDTLHDVISFKIDAAHRNEVITALNAIPNTTAADNKYINESILHYVVDDFNQLVFYSGLLVFIALLIAYGRIELALISFIPMAISWIWILGIMSLLGISFNFVNIIICTLIFGLGDDYSIFMTDSMMETYKKGKNDIKVSRSAIYFSAITTLLGLGILIVAEHPVLKSIAIIAVLGLSIVVLVSQVLQPMLFQYFILNRAKKGLLPFTLFSFLKTIVAYTYFIIGCIITTIVGICLLFIKPFGQQKSKLYFHYTMSFFMKSTLFLMGNILKKIHVADQTVYNQPAVWVANHSSFLDILIMIAIQPKAVLLTAEWVWKNPVFGMIVRMAEYYPVVNGAEESLTHLEQLVKKGYSVIVFPEGTRSKTDKIHRFKKGASYIAHALNIPIVPVTIHGAHYNIEKHDFLLKNGSVTVHVDKAVDPKSFEQYSQLSKHVQSQIRTQYAALKTSIETPTYYKNYLIHSHIYKGPVLEWYVRIKAKMEQYYEPFHALLPQQGKIYDLGCGYGMMSFMLHWAAKERQIIGIDYDDEKILTAQQHLYFNSHTYQEIAKDKPMLTFVHGDLTQISLEPCDAIIISDALHYLLPEAQWQLLEHCYDALVAGGKLIVRDGVTDMKERHEQTEMTEKYSTEIIKFNKTTNELTFINKANMEAWAKAKGMQLTIHDFYKKLSNLTFEFVK